MPRSPAEEALSELQYGQGEMLESFGNLRTLGHGDHIDPPKLVICGCKQTGKSSVLDAITRIRFSQPYSTRLPIEVAFRRSSTANIKVSIISSNNEAGDREEDGREDMAPGSVFEVDDLPSAVRETEKILGSADDQRLTAGDHILRMSCCGPAMPELTLVDLPGFDFPSLCKEETDQGWPLDRLVRRYMEDPLTTLIVVVSAKVTDNWQRAFENIKTYDPDGVRTLGVVTCLDMTDPNAHEHQLALELLQNKRFPLELQWHAIVNRSSSEYVISDQARDTKEDICLSYEPRASRLIGCRGAREFRRGLAGLLRGKLCESMFPQWKDEIVRQFKIIQEKRLILGPPRPTVQKQRAILYGTSEEFQRLALHALTGAYGDVFFKWSGTGRLGCRCLRFVVQRLKNDFVEAITLRGGRKKIIDAGGMVAEHDRMRQAIQSDNLYMGFWDGIFVDRQTQAAEFDYELRGERDLVKRGYLSTRLVVDLLRDLTESWDELAEKHLMAVLQALREFTSELLQHLAGDTLGASLFTRFMDARLRDAQGAAIKQKAVALDRLRPKHPSLSGTSLNDWNRIALALPGLQNPRYEAVGPDVGRMAANVEESDNLMTGADLVGWAEKHYHRTCDEFVFRLNSLIIEGFLRSGMEGAFTARDVHSLRDDQVQELAAESTDAMTERDALAQEYEILRATARSFAFHAKIGYGKNPRTGECGI
ncbi:hypothetical protein P168DRAFT_276110 [Aspergillus campestris IBT 28561]|uniref:Dynamin-type G domain-containing protein n=1 Tax=Aspergillus campestris (strain IBT 28561) TaxID=1392248 RepID=A0A2I1CRI5_ASPC2|nr:uncharacterized protein P168DRAFT_276110 [Aspergillus campestris IBT 28561]PKY00241.1 hypothetical protein P168DRAFT_276110 [Aspergillus campestris IBT 28561]